MTEENDSQTSSTIADSGKRCKTCGYNLTGLTEYRCPECGSFFGPYELDFKARRWQKSRGWLGAQAIVLSISLTMALLVTVVVVITVVQPDKSSFHPFLPSSHGTALMLFIVFQLPVSTIGLLFGLIGAQSKGWRRTGTFLLAVLLGISAFMITVMFRRR